MYITNKIYHLSQRCFTICAYCW